MKKVLITAALPYANGALHFGHIAGAYLPADCYARFERLQGSDVLFISGTDEYGVAITLAAELAGRTPQAHVDHYHKVIADFFAELHLSFDHFSRTTCSEHAPLVCAFFEDLLQAGYIEKKETEQLYSVEDQRFLADRYVKGRCPRCGFEEARGDECGKCGASFEATDLLEPKSKLTGAPLTLRKSTHWFLLFDRFTKQLREFLQARTFKPNVHNFASHYLEDLHPRAITRDLEWGVAVPLQEAKGKVFYVWFDAPIGYISATKEWANKRGEPEAWKKYWCDPKTHYVQFMGKDNIPFHALFFPAMIMGQSQPYKLVDELVANEFYNLEGKQFSKSEGWTIDLSTFFQKFTADQIRYVIAANAPENADSEFTWRDFGMRCNADLVGKLGNFINRVLVFVQNQCGGKVPEKGTLEPVDEEYLAGVERLFSEVEEQYRAHRLRRASQVMMELAQLGNGYFDAKAPWKDAKTNVARMKTTIHLCLEGIKRLAMVMMPIMPEAAKKVWQMLHMTPPKRWQEGKILPHTELPKPEILFQKVEDEVIEKEMEALEEMHKNASEKTCSYEPLKPEIAYEDFAKLDMRVATIIAAEPLAKSKKLLKLLVDLGFEKRTVVSGISLHYTPEQLIGKKVVLLANLKPAKLMGVESQGMILAGSIDAQMEVLSIQNLPNGSEIT